MRRDPDEAVGGLQRWLDRVSAAPWKSGFIAFLRRHAAAHPGEPPLGTSRRPREESIRLGQCAALTFAPREVADLILPRPDADIAPERDPGNRDGAADAPPRARIGINPDLPLLRVYGLGLWGPHGPMPLHATELVRERAEHHQDGTLANFIDIFHHRYLTLFYRAWAQGQAAAGLDRAEDETYTRYLAPLAGLDGAASPDPALPAHALLAAAAHWAGESRHPDGLAQTLAHYFRIPVRLEEYALAWIAIEPEDETHLGRPGDAAVLGHGAIAGAAVADRQHRFRLVLGPLDMDAYLGYTPVGSNMPALVAWVRAYVGHTYAWELELRLHAAAVPAARLGAPHRLGWSTWLVGAPNDPSTPTSTVPSAGTDGRASRPYAVGLVCEPDIATSSRLAAGTARSPSAP